MQILTKVVFVCALAATLGPLSSRGADTDAQMKAREALRQKMGELDVQPAVTNAPAVAPTKAPKTKAATAPAATQPAPTVTEPPPAETVKTVPPPTPAPARTVEPTPTPTPAPAPVVKSTRQPKPVPVMKASQASGQMTASRPDSERVAKAREALEVKMKELETQGSQPAAAVASQPPANQPPAAATQPPTVPTATRTHEISSANQPHPSVETTEPLPTPPPVKRSAEAEPKSQKSKKPREARPMPESRPMYALPQGPPPPVSADKVQKLNALLQQYQADRITPEQYHQERAKILAGP